MAEIFYSCSFSGKVDYATGLVDPEFRKVIEDDLCVLRELGHRVFCAVEAEQWKIGNVPPGEAVTWDVDEIDKADVLVARLETSVSAGVQWEIGYAHGKGKPVYVFAGEGQDLAYWNQGLVESSRIHLIGALRDISIESDITKK